MTQMTPLTPPICNGRGDNGSHCCTIEGKTCRFLVEIDGTPRCSIWDQMDTPRWRRSRVGRWMNERYPGYTCRDWPQNIPEVMNNANNLCCWNS